MQYPPGGTFAPEASGWTECCTWVGSVLLASFCSSHGQGSSTWPGRGGEQAACIPPLVLVNGGPLLPGQNSSQSCVLSAEHAAHPPGASPRGHRPGPCLQEAMDAGALEQDRQPQRDRVYDDWSRGERDAPEQRGRACLPTSSHSCLPTCGVPTGAPQEADSETRKC